MKSNYPLAVWSLILGVLSIIPCGPIAAIPAIICGHRARSRIKIEADVYTGDGMALAGLIMGYFSIVLFFLLALIGIMIAITAPAMIKMFQDMQNITNQPSCNLIINMVSSLT